MRKIWNEIHHTKMGSKIEAMSKIVNKVFFLFQKQP